MGFNQNWILIKNWIFPFSQVKISQETLFNLILFCFYLLYFILLHLCFSPPFSFWQPHVSTPFPFLLSAVSWGGAPHLLTQPSTGSLAQEWRSPQHHWCSPGKANSWLCCHHQVVEANQVSILLGWVLAGMGTGWDGYPGGYWLSWVQQ